MHESRSWQETKLSPDSSNEKALKKGLLAEEKAELVNRTRGRNREACRDSGSQEALRLMERG